MPSRVIRDGLLDSERYWSVTIEAQRLFLHLLLLADDFGLVSLALAFIRRRCFDDAPTPAKIDKLIDMLADADLIRIYEARGGRYAYVPRFRQRLRQMRAKNPPPPRGLFSDDEDATNLFNSHWHLFEKMSASRRRPADNPRPEVEGKRREGEVGREGESRGETKTTAVAASHDWRAWARERGISPAFGEGDLQFQLRVAEERRRQATEPS
jgi:hypothetical protein